MTSNEFFRVPNTQEGLNQIEIIRKTLNRKVYFLKIVGRRKNRKELLRYKPGCNYMIFVPLKFATELCVYIYRKKGDEYNSHVLRWKDERQSRRVATKIPIW